MSVTSITPLIPLATAALLPPASALPQVMTDPSALSAEKAWALE